MNAILKYFDLMSNVREGINRGVAVARDGQITEQPPKMPAVWPQYLALILGILIQPFFMAYQQTGAWNFEGFVGRILFALICGIMILPAVYKNTFDETKPILLQFCTLFVSGMGWQSLLGTVLKGVGG